MVVLGNEKGRTRPGRPPQYKDRMPGAREAEPHFGKNTWEVNVSSYKHLASCGGGIGD